MQPPICLGQRAILCCPPPRPALTLSPLSPLDHTARSFAHAPKTPTLAAPLAHAKQNTHARCSAPTHPMVSSLPRLLVAAAAATLAAAAAVCALPVARNHPHFRPTPACNASDAAIPLMASALWVDPQDRHAAPSHARTAMVVQHGAARNFRAAFNALTANLDLRDTVVVAPNFFVESDDPSAYFDPDTTLTWENNHGWVNGQDAVNAPGCSSYDVVDFLHYQFLDRSKYPSMQHIYFLGHSDGAAFISRYAVVKDDYSTHQARVTFVTANAPSVPYFTHFRPDTQFFAHGDCSGWNDWGYGVHDLQQSRYASSRWQGAEAMFSRFIHRRVLTMVGDIDTHQRYSFGDVSCPALLQGGHNRRERGYNAWVYHVLLAGAQDSANVGGEKRLRPFRKFNEISSSVSPMVTGQPFHHQFCVVPHVGHRAKDMWGSDCGQSILLKDNIPSYQWGYPATP